MVLDWEDLDLDADRGMVRRRYYRGEFDLPKSNRERMISLVPPAREALDALREMEGYEPFGLVSETRRVAC